MRLRALSRPELIYKVTQYISWGFRCPLGMKVIDSAVFSRQFCELVIGDE